MLIGEVSGVVDPQALEEMTGGVRVRESAFIDGTSLREIQHLLSNVTTHKKDSLVVLIGVLYLKNKLCIKSKNTRFIQQLLEALSKNTPLLRDHFLRTLSTIKKLDTAVAKKLGEYPYNSLFLPESFYLSTLSRALLR